MTTLVNLSKENEFPPAFGYSMEDDENDSDTRWKTMGTNTSPSTHSEDEIGVHHTVLNGLDDLDRDVGDCDSDVSTPLSEMEMDIQLENYFQFINAAGMVDIGFQMRPEQVVEASTVEKTTSDKKENQTICLKKGESIFTHYIDSFTDEGKVNIEKSMFAAVSAETATSSSTIIQGLDGLITEYSDLLKMSCNTENIDLCLEENQTLYKRSVASLTEALWAQRASKSQREGMVHSPVEALIMFLPLDFGPRVVKTLVEWIINTLNSAFHDPDFTQACLRGVRYDFTQSVWVVKKSEEESDNSSVPISIPPHFIEAVQQLRNYQLVFEFRVDGDSQLEMADTIVSSVTTESVLEEYGRPNGDKTPRRWHELISKIGKHRHLHAKFSGFQKKESEAQISYYIKKCLRAFGPDRCLFSIDWPEKGYADYKARYKPKDLKRSDKLDHVPLTRYIKMILRCILDSYHEENGLASRPTSRESSWTLGFANNYDNDLTKKLDLKTQLTIEKIFKKNAERKYII